MKESQPPTARVISLRNPRFSCARGVFASSGGETVPSAGRSSATRALIGDVPASAIIC